MLKYNNNKRRKWKRKRKRKGNAKTGRRVISASGAFEIEERNLAQWCVRDLKMKLKPMDDIMWNRWFSWQRQPIFGTWAVDISSSSARYTFRGNAFDFWPHCREDSRLSASLHHLSREKETSLLHRDYRTFFLSIFSSITPTFLSLIPCLLLLPIDVHIYTYIFSVRLSHLACHVKWLERSIFSQIQQRISWNAKRIVDLTIVLTTPLPYSLLAWKLLRGKSFRRRVPTQVLRAKLESQQRGGTGEGREKEMQLGGKDFAGAAHNFARKFDIQNRKWTMLLYTSSTDAVAVHLYRYTGGCSFAKNSPD